MRYDDEAGRAFQVPERYLLQLRRLNIPERAGAQKASRERRVRHDGSKQCTRCSGSNDNNVGGVGDVKDSRASRVVTEFHVRLRRDVRQQIHFLLIEIAQVEIRGM